MRDEELDPSKDEGRGRGLVDRSLTQVWSRRVSLGCVLNQGFHCREGRTGSGAVDLRGERPFSDLCLAGNTHRVALPNTSLLGQLGRWFSGPDRASRPLPPVPHPHPVQPSNLLLNWVQGDLEVFIVLCSTVKMEESDHLLLVLCIKNIGNTILFVYLFISNLFILFIFIFGCVGSSLLRTGFL